MFLTARNGVQHLQNWSSARLGVISRLVLAGDSVKCQVTGLSFGKQDGRIGIPVPDVNRGQGIHIEFKHSGPLLRINGKDLTWVKETGGLEFDGVAIPPGSNALRRMSFLRIFKGKLRFILWNDPAFTEQEANVDTDALGITPIESLEVYESVHLIEIHDTDERFYANHIIPLSNTGVFNKFEYDRLLYSSGQTPAVGVYGDIRVEEAPSSLMAVNVKLTDQTRTLRFTHIVGMADIGFASEGFPGSYEQVTILFHNTYALVMFGDSLEVKGKFRYTAGHYLELLNVFNVKYFEGDVTMSPGRRFYSCNDNTDVGLDTLMYMTDRRYDFAAGNDWGGAATGLTVASADFLLPDRPEGAAAYGLVLDRNISNQSHTGDVIRFSSELGEFSLTIRSGRLHLRDNEGKYRPEALVTSGVNTLTLVFYEDSAVLVCGRKLVKFDSVGIVASAYIPRTTAVEPRFDKIVVFAANGPVLPDGEVFADALDGEGFVGEYSRGNAEQGRVTVELPAHSYRRENDQELPVSAVGAKFEAYLLENNHNDAVPAIRSRVDAKFEAYFLENNHEDAVPAIRSRVDAKFKAYMIEDRPGDAPYAPAPELTVDGIHMYVALDGDDDPNLNQNFDVPELTVDGIHMYVALDGDDDPELNQNFDKPELTVDGIFMYVAEVPIYG